MIRNSLMTMPLFIAEIAMVWSCANSAPDRKLITVNQSKDTLYYTITNLPGLKVLYDSSVLWEARARKLPNQARLDFQYFPLTKINPLSNRRNTASNSWEYYIDNFSADHKIRIYVFNADTLMRLGIKNTLNNDRYLSRQELNVTQLKNQDWRITIP